MFSAKKICFALLLCIILSSTNTIAAIPYDHELAGRYETVAGYPKSNRVANIVRAAELIDGYIIYPDELFSFNEATGPTTKKNGFLKARVFVKGRDAKGYGGGVCQVSSTLLNAAIDAQLTVIERHSHSKDVGYVPENMDAAVTYGGKDLKFINSLDSPVMICAYTVENRLVVEIYRIY